MYTERIVRNVPSDITFTFVNGDDLVDPDGNAATVTITKADGSVVVTDAAATRISQGKYKYTLPGQSDLNLLKAVWTGEFSTLDRSETSYVEIAGAYFFTLRELRNYDAVLQQARFTDELLSNERRRTEDEFERVTGRGFVPRFMREVLYGEDTNTLWLEKPEVHAVTKLTVDGEDKLSLIDDGTIAADSSNLHVLRWTGGKFYSDAKVVIEYEYGSEIVPYECKRLAMKRARGMLLGDQAKIDERATSMVNEQGSFRLSTPGFRGAFTGIPDIDVYLNSMMLGGDAGIGVA